MDKISSKWVRRAFNLLFVIALAPVAGQWFVKLAEQYGAYDDPARQVVTALSQIVPFISDPRYNLVLAFLGGLALGRRIDATLRRRESHTRQVDRDALADEAKNLAQNVSVLAGELVGKQRIAWNEDMQTLHLSATSGGRPEPSRTRSTIVEAQVLEKYNVLYRVAVESLMVRASKLN